TGRGFKEVYNLKGGIKAWQGLTAMGPVELNLDLISGQETPAEMIIIAYGLEEALSHFYRVVVEKVKEEEVSLLLKKLGEMEEQHQKMLRDEYKKTQGQDFDDLPKTADRPLEILEGGFKFSEFLSQNEAAMQTLSGVLDVAMMLEAQALDLYRRFGMKATQEDTQNILYKIADEEKAHLVSLGKLLEKKSQ
ncbi:MAG: sulfurtransferase, partial [Desulfobacca sp.]|nr:sulfurtransferase [Desulfobacca sp.]